MGEYYKILVIHHENKQVLHEDNNGDMDAAVKRAIDLWINYSPCYVDVRFFAEESDGGIVARIGGLGFPDNK